jgi:hypothetical protein
VTADPPGIEPVVRRVKRRALAVAAVGVIAAFVVSWRSGLSLTIAAAVVIFSFLVLEKLMDRLGPAPANPGSRAFRPLLAVTGGSFAILALVLWRWKGFDAVAGAAGLSVVVLAVIPEIWTKE